MPDNFFEEVLAPSLKEGADISVVKNTFSEYLQKQNEEFTQGLRTNRDQILNEKKDLSVKMQEYQDKYSFLEGKEFNIDTYNNMVSEIDTYKSTATKDDEEFQHKLSEQYLKGKKSYEETITPTVNSLKMQLEQEKKTSGEYQSKYQNYLAENKLRSSLSKMGVDADEYFFEGFKNKAKIEYGENGIQNINVYHDGGHIPLEDWERIFPTTTLGKKMIRVPVNSGGASHGSKGSGGESNTLEDISLIADPKARQSALVKYMEKNS